MSQNSVLVHRCRNVRYKALLAKCGCREHISRRRADEKVGKGDASWLADAKGNRDYGHLFVTTPKWSEVPRAQTVGERHILKAVGDSSTQAESSYHRERIELYGQMGQESLVQSGSASKTTREGYMANVRQTRKQFGLSLNELAAVLGPGFSPARLSLAERGLIQPSKAEEQVILAAIERLGALRSEVRDIIERASNIDFKSVCQDIRQRAQSLQAVV